MGGGGSGEQHGDAQGDLVLLLLRRAVDPSLLRLDLWKTDETLLTPLQPHAGQLKKSHVSPRIAEQCFFMFAEPKNYFQEEAKAISEPGPSADATLWYRRRRDTVWGQWPSCVDCQIWLHGISDSIRKPDLTKHVLIIYLLLNICYVDIGTGCDGIRLWRCCVNSLTLVMLTAIVTNLIFSLIYWN